MVVSALQKILCFTLSALASHLSDAFNEAALDNVVPLVQSRTISTTVSWSVLSGTVGAATAILGFFLSSVSQCACFKPEAAGNM